MNTNHQEHDERGEAQRLHELLCATILGEASDEERAEVERALEASSDLRAERDRLQATIGLVTSSLNVDGQLSPSAANELRSALAKRQRRVWYRTPAFRMAASVLLIPLAWVAWRAIDGSRVASPSRTERASGLDLLAKADSSANARERSAAKPEMLKQLGYLGDSTSATSTEDRKLGLDDKGRDFNAPSSSTKDSESLGKPSELPAVKLETRDALTSQSAGVAGESEVAKIDEKIAQLRDGIIHSGFHPAHSAYVQVQAQIEALERQKKSLGTASDPNPAKAALSGTAPAPGAIVDLNGNTNSTGTASFDLSYSNSPKGDAGSASNAVSRFQGGVAKPSIAPGTQTVDGGRAKKADELARSGSVGGELGWNDPKGGVDLRNGKDFYGTKVKPTEPATGIDGQSLIGLDAEKGFDNHLKQKTENFFDAQTVERLRKLGYAKDGMELEGFDVPPYDNDESKRRGDSADDVSIGANGDIRRIHKLSPDEIESRVKIILDGCRRRPGEEPRDMFFRFWGDNPFEITSLHKLSTFAIDVDTASYALARNYLVKGYLPPKEEVRTEEFVNYFKGDVQPPTTGTFAVETEMAPSLFGETPDCWMLRVAVRGKEVSKSERAPLALTFIIDVSGSMREENRLELVKHSLRLLAAQLDARDSVAVVTFSDIAQLILPMTSAKNRVAIENAIAPLEPQSSTNTEAGLKLGYEHALANFVSGAQNRVVLLTDGVANVGVTDPNVMSAEVAEERKAGIFLNTIGVGMNNHNDNLLEQLADKGDGVCNYVDDAKEAQRALVDNFTGAFQPIARDVKIQVEFDATQISRYRLLGYENRALADQDFRNDKVDAGEVGAGHQVVALYEVQRTGATGDGPLATVRIRWKPPILEGKRNEATEKATEMEHPVTFKSSADAFARTTAGYRRSVLVSQFAEFLRRSVHARGDSLDRLIDEAKKLDGEMKDNDFHEFVAMVEKSKALVLAQSARSEIQVKLDEYRVRQCQRAELESLKTDATLLAKLDAQNSEMEATLRELLRKRLQQPQVRDQKLEDHIRQLGYLDDTRDH